MKVFISYSSNDRDFVVNKLYNRLKNDDIDCFLDQEDIKPGDSWVSKLEQGLKNCDAIIFIISKNFVKSKWTEIEKNAAFSDNKKMFVILLDKTEPPYFLKSIQSIDASGKVLIDKDYNSLCKILGGSPKGEQTQKYELYLMCNRGIQEIDFLRNFSTDQLQFYIIFGHSNDEHENLIERFRVSTIPQLTKNEWNKEIKPGHIKVDWPETGSYEDLQFRLAGNFLNKLDGKLRSAPKLNDLARLNCMQDSKIYIIKHELSTKNWSNQKKLIKWYIEELRLAVQSKPVKLPLLLIFFKLKKNYNWFSKLFFCQKIKKLKKFIDDKIDSSACCLIRQLNLITHKNVEDWLGNFDQNDFADNFKKIFSTKICENGELKRLKRIANKRHMGDILQLLRDIEDDYAREKSGLHQ